MNLELLAEARSKLLDKYWGWEKLGDALNLGT